MKNPQRLAAAVNPWTKPAGWQAIIVLVLFISVSLLIPPSAAAATAPGSSMYLAKPGDVTVTAVSTSQINLAWKDVSGYETGYSIERRAEDELFTQIALMPANTQAYSDSGLAPGTFYTYRVKAIGNGSDIYDSAYSAEVSARTYYEVIVIPVVPGTPTGLTATAVSASQIGLSWTDQSNNETGYRIERKTVSTDFVPINATAPNTQT
ncbi:MAG: fibronectin type III domain-containing protein, partial [Syntrophomonadaceae bacterium]